MPQKKTIKVSPKAYALFQAEFERWQAVFGLSHYRVIFRFEPLGKSYTMVGTSEMDKYAIVTLTSELKPEEVEGFDPVRSAKHEGIHLLLRRFAWLASCRYLMAEDLEEEEHAIVRRLEAVL
ncbi:MAG: hypothetical protein V2A79_09785 [Planctomycetota bacterium]